MWKYKFLVSCVAIGWRKKNYGGFSENLLLYCVDFIEYIIVMYRIPTHKLLKGNKLMDVHPIFVFGVLRLILLQ